MREKESPLWSLMADEGGDRKALWIEGRRVDGWRGEGMAKRGCRKG